VQRDAVGGVSGAELGQVVDDLASARRRSSPLTVA
jgi:hypothetical protein